MDNVYQVAYGPVQDKLKYAGTVWLGLSLVANFGRADLGGFIGLIAVLAVLISSLYLLRLVSIFALFPYKGNPTIKLHRQSLLQNPFAPSLLLVPCNL